MNFQQKHSLKLNAKDSFSISFSIRIYISLFGPHKEAWDVNVEFRHVFVVVVFSNKRANQIDWIEPKPFFFGYRRYKFMSKKFLFFLLKVNPILFLLLPKFIIHSARTNWWRNAKNEDAYEFKSIASQSKRENIVDWTRHILAFFVYNEISFNGFCFDDCRFIVYFEFFHYNLLRRVHGISISFVSAKRWPIWVEIESAFLYTAIIILFQ